MSPYFDIIQKYNEIQISGLDDDRFNVIKIGDLSHRLGRSVEGYPKFFVKTNESSSTVQNVIREFLSVEYNVPCELIDDDYNSISDSFSIITLMSSDENLRSYFIEIFMMMLEKMPSVPSKRELSLEVETLITIFSALSNPPRKKIQGLWAELLVIEQGRYPETLINAWHSLPSSKYDFTLGRDKIEVKSTSSEERIHTFSLDQLNPSVNSNLVIASVIVRESGQSNEGLSVKNLYERICTRVTVINNRLKLYKVIAETIGNDIKKLDNVFYDYVSAVDTLHFYDYNDVPRISRENVPEGVSDVKFSSNLTHLIDIRSQESAFETENSNLYKSIM